MSNLLIGQGVGLIVGEEEMCDDVPESLMQSKSLTASAPALSLEIIIDPLWVFPEMVDKQG